MLGQLLVSHARLSMLHKLRGLALPELPDALLGLKYGVFVTVEGIVRSGGYERREVRGSLGTVFPMQDLGHDVARIAARLAVSIPRFTEFDLRRSVIEVTLVEGLSEWDGDLSNFAWGREGVYVEAGERRFVVLPQTIIERRLFGEALLR